MIFNEVYNEGENYMQKEVAQSLSRQSEKLAELMAKREGRNERFYFDHAIIHSHDSATVIYLKEFGLKAAASFRYIPAFKDLPCEGWLSGWPTDGHIIGMAAFGKIKQEIEDYNFLINTENNEPEKSEVPEE